MPDDANSRPTPDPTILTTEQLLREIGNAKELVLSEVRRVEDVTSEQFESVDNQFTLVERQRVEQKVDTATAVAAALAAAKEAVTEQTAASEKSITKSETATAEQLRQLTATFTTALGGLTNIVDDLKERVGKIESIRVGGQEWQTDRYRANTDRTQWMQVVIAVLMVAVIVAVAYAASKK